MDAITGMELCRQVSMIGQEVADTIPAVGEAHLEGINIIDLMVQEELEQALM